MIKTDELFAEAVSLPVDVRTQLVDTLLRSLNPMQKEIDKMWADETEKRVEEVRSGKVKTIPGEVEGFRILKQHIHHLLNRCYANQFKRASAFYL